MVTSRRTFLQEMALLTCALPGITSFKSSTAQSVEPRIGYLNGAGLNEHDDAFISELQKLGFSDGKNFTIEKRFTRPNSGDAFGHARELAQMDLALVVVSAPAFVEQVRKVNPNMPMVLITCPGMVSNGYAASLDHPGGIYTGMDELPPGITSKRLQLLKTAAPAVTKIALLSTTQGKGGHEIQLSEAEKSAPELGLSIKAYRAASLPELEKALSEIISDKMNGLLNFQGGLTLANRKLLADFAVTNKIPAIYQATLIVEAGGLMSWAPDLVQQFREAAHYVNKILRGSKPGDLPIQHPKKYYLTINQSAADLIGLSLPSELISQADRIIR